MNIYQYKTEMEAAMLLIACTAAFASLPVILAVAARQPPKITQPQGNSWPASMDYVRQQTPRVTHCKAIGSPALRYKWTRNDTELPKVASRYESVSYNETSGDLIFDRFFNSLGNGDYQCIVYNKYGAAITPYITLIATETHAFPGSESGSVTPERSFTSQYLVLECKDVPYSVPPWTFKWERGKEPNRWSWGSIKDQQDRLIVDPLGRLHFLWVEPSDHSLYYVCLAKNDVLLVESRNTNSILLTVHDGSRNDRGPELKYNPDVEVMAGDDAVLMCIFTYYSAVKEPLSIKWFFHGDMVGTGYKHVINDVSVPTTTHSKEGEYLCEARIGNKMARGRVNLKINAPPQFIPGQELTSMSAPVGGDVTFTCGSTSHGSYTEPTVWMVNAVPLLGCPHNRFECLKKKPNDFPQCLGPAEKKCDSVPDCLDGSDEDDCSKVSCSEGQIICNGECQSMTRECQLRTTTCTFPDFTCKDGTACVGSRLRCDGRPDCMDHSDELNCPNGPDIKIGKYVISSDRTYLSLSNVGVNDVMCVQCITSNPHGTLVGNACLLVVYKIDVLRKPEKTYYAVPGRDILISVSAKTDKQWQNQMKYTWVMYESVMDSETKQWKKVVVNLPAPEIKDFIRFSYDQQNMTILIPKLDQGQDNADEYEIFRKLVNRNYAVIISHQYDEVTLPFEITGNEDFTPESRLVSKKAWPTAGLWAVLIMLGAIMLVFIVCLGGVCYAYRNRGGDYYLDKKEKEAGHNPEHELASTSLHDASRIYDTTVSDDVTFGGGNIGLMGTWSKVIRQAKRLNEEEEEEEKKTKGDQGHLTNKHAPLAKQITM